MAKQRLVENFIVPARLIEKVDAPLHEAKVEGKVFEVLGVYRFPFTRPGLKNQNNRIYPRALWDRLFKINPTTVSLVDHPDGDGDPARIWAVMKNAGYNKDKTLGMVDCYILNNDFGRTALGVLSAGGDIGLSSSGLGDFEIDGETIAADSYELERWADWVLNPSYSVFGRLDAGLSEVTMDSVKNSNDTKLQEDKTFEKKLSLREKREIEISLKKVYEDVKGVKSVKERLERAKEALTFYEDIETDVLKTDFENIVKEAEDEINNAIVKAESIDLVKKETETMAQAVENSNEIIESLKKENELFKKENGELKTENDELKKATTVGDELVESLSQVVKGTVPYNDYATLREYAVRATKLYSKLKNACEVQELTLQNYDVSRTNRKKETELRSIKEAKLMVQEVRQRKQRLKAESLRAARIREAKEQEFMSRVSPEVLEYYNDLQRMGEDVSHLRVKILSCRTLVEAQMTALKAKHNNARIQEVTPRRDLSAPIPVKNYRQVLPDISMNIPKGFI